MIIYVLVILFGSNHAHSITLFPEPHSCAMVKKAYEEDQQAEVIVDCEGMPAPGTRLPDGWSPFE